MVAPGWTVTPAVTHFVTNPSAVQSTLQLVATRRLSFPEDVAMSVLFLASDRAARQITGRVLWRADEALAVWQQEQRRTPHHGTADPFRASLMTVGDLSRGVH